MVFLGLQTSDNPSFNQLLCSVELIAVVQYIASSFQLLKFKYDKRFRNVDPQAIEAANRGNVHRTLGFEECSKGQGASMFIPPAIKILVLVLQGQNAKSEP